jgi:hypothetical protein
MPARRLRLVAPLLGLLVALVAVIAAAAGGDLAAGADDRVPGQVEQARVPVADDAAVVLRSGVDHLRPHAAPAGLPLGWLAAAACAAAALVAGAIAPDAVAVPSRTTAHVRRRGPPSPV